MEISKNFPASQITEKKVKHDKRNTTAIPQQCNDKEEYVNPTKECNQPKEECADLTKQCIQSKHFFFFHPQNTIITAQKKSNTTVCKFIGGNEEIYSTKK